MTITAPQKPSMWEMFVPKNFELIELGSMLLNAAVSSKSGFFTIGIGTLCVGSVMSVQAYNNCQTLQDGLKKTTQFFNNMIQYINEHKLPITTMGFFLIGIGSQYHKIPTFNLFYTSLKRLLDPIATLEKKYLNIK